MRHRLSIMLTSIIIFFATTSCIAGNITTPISPTTVYPIPTQLIETYPIHTLFAPTTAPILTSTALPQPSPTLPPTNPPLPKGVFYQPATTCTASECLFVHYLEPEYPIGLAEVTGYFVQNERSGFNATTAMCDGLVMISGSTTISESISALITQGNTVHIKDDAGHPIIGLNLETASLADQALIRASTPERLITLQLLAQTPSQQGAPLCYSRFEILQVK